MAFGIKARIERTVGWNSLECRPALVKIMNQNSTMSRGMKPPLEV